MFTELRTDITDTVTVDIRLIPIGSELAVVQKVAHSIAVRILSVNTFGIASTRWNDVVLGNTWTLVLRNAKAIAICVIFWIKWATHVEKQRKRVSREVSKQERARRKKGTNTP
jgi:lysylphosphatidylglycerol synthetase-like protein (DUF2156 family)